MAQIDPTCQVLQAKIEQLTHQFIILQSRVKHLESRLKQAEKKINLFEGLIQNKDMSPSERIGAYALVQAQEEEGRRVDAGQATNYSEKTLKTEQKKLKKAQEDGLFHVYVGRIANLSGLSKNTVSTLLKKLQAGNYIELVYIRMWGEFTDGDECIRKELFINASGVAKKPREINLKDHVTRQVVSKNAIMILPGHCYDCGSENVEHSARVVCRDCGTVHVISPSKGQSNGRKHASRVKGLLLASGRNVPETGRCALPGKGA